MEERRLSPRIKAVVAVCASIFIWLLTASGLLLHSQSRMAGEIGRMAGQIAELNRAVNRLARLPADGADAETSVTMGREAIRKGEWGIGQLYFVNAVTNAPRRPDHPDAYTTAVLEKDNIPIDAL